MQRSMLGILALITSVPFLDCGTSAQSERVNAGGSSFVYHLMSDWADTYARDKGVQVNYQSKDSGTGIQKMLAKEFDFGSSDAPLNEERMEEARKNGSEAIHIPVTMGAVVVVYNLAEARKPLQFTGEILAKVFMGQITR